MWGLVFHSVLERDGDGRSGTRAQGAGGRPAQPRSLVGQGRESLGVGLTCPPVALGHNEGGGRQPATVADGVECTNGNDGGIPGGPYGPVPAIGGGLCFAGNLNAGYIVHLVRGTETAGSREGTCRIECLRTFHRLDGRGRDTGPDGMRRWRLSLVPRVAWRPLGWA